MKKILKAFNRKWLDYLIEVFVIVISVLGAFWLDRGYERLKRSKEEQKMMKQIRTNLIHDKELLIEGINAANLREKAYKTSLNSVNIDCLELTAKRILESEEVDFDQSAFEQFKSTGRLEMLNDELFILLQELYLDYEKNEENRAYYQEVVEKQIRPLYVKIAFADQNEISFSEEGKAKAKKEDLNKFLSSKDLREPIILQTYTSSEIRKQYMEHLEKIGKILDLLKRQIED